MAKIAPQARNMLYQVGTLQSLLQGVDQGDVTFAELAHYGDFGLGTFDLVAGEMVALDGHFYRIDGQGRVQSVSPQDRTPFALVTRFTASREIELGPLASWDRLCSRLLSELPSPNIIYALRVDADMAFIQVRSEHPQPPGHHPLAETLPQVQESFALGPISGSLVGFWFPRHLEDLNLADFHFHFLDDAHERGGHVFELEITRATARIQPIHDLGMHLIHNRLFESRDLAHPDHNAEDKVEHG